MKQDRRQKALEIRKAAADLAANRPHPRHVANGDEQKFRFSKSGRPSYLASFTKGLPHDYQTGLLSELEYDAFQRFVDGIDSGDVRDFVGTPLGPIDYGMNPSPWRSAKANTGKPGPNPKGGEPVGLRAWESQACGLAFELEGPDPQAVTMPPAPALGSEELTAEMGEVYVQALLRDVPFTEIVDETGDILPAAGQPPISTVKKLLAELNKLEWFADDGCCDLTPAERSRRRGPFSGQTAFRGITPGDDVGPYISQFLLSGNRGVNGNDASRKREDGLVSYGALTVDQRVRFATPYHDYMQTWDEWYDVQQAANVSGLESYEAKPLQRFITTPRDLATYVHYDALYEAYLNACLILLAEGAHFDPGLPFREKDHIDHQQGFAHFGGPHILSLVTEVATRALKAVRFQKFNVHRRLRPEALAARLAKRGEADVGQPAVHQMYCDLKPILEVVAKRNPLDKANLPGGNFLLPMAFCEGSPMHPAYGAGHATVAGACVTILKAFFDHERELTLAGSSDTAFVPSKDGKSLKPVKVLRPARPGETDDNCKPIKAGKLVPAKLTVEGELNKLASNIAIGRDWAGVHYFTDYIESLRMGEQIAIGILEEQRLTYGETFSMTVPLFDGGSIRI